MADSRFTLIVTGRVQGVGFRYFTAQAARRLGLCGTVRNLPDGGVEVVAEGAPELLEALVAAVRQGPLASRVDDLLVVPGPAVGLGPGFVITG